MAVRGATNPELVRLIDLLNSRSREKNAPVWGRVAECLSAPRRNAVVVNVSKIERFSGDGETVIVPGKVLGSGILTKRVTVAAFGYSKDAQDKITKAGGRVVQLEELLEKNPDGKGLKILK